MQFPTGSREVSLDLKRWQGACLWRCFRNQPITSTPCSGKAHGRLYGSCRNGSFQTFGGHLCGGVSITRIRICGDMRGPHWGSR